MKTTLLLLLTAVGCSEYDLRGDALVPDPEGAEAEASGGVSGRICDPNASSWVAAARVWTTVASEDGAPRVVETTTDFQGFYTLKGLPEGEYTVFVEKGSFETTLSVSVAEGRIHEQVEPTCLDPDSVNIAVLLGAFDPIEELLDEMALDYDAIPEAEQAAFLNDRQRMMAYDILFFDCGMSDDWTWDKPQVVGDNLRAFVGEGRSMYVSDWAFATVEVAYPGAIDFLGDDAFWAEAYGGDSGEVTGAVRDATMEGLLGKPSAEIAYDLSGWVVMEDAGPQTEVLLTGDISTFAGRLSDRPLAVQLAPAGRVIFTTFHNEAQRTEDMEVVLKEIILSL